MATEGSEGDKGAIEVDPVRYWTAALVTGLIAAIAAIVIVRFAGDVLDTPLFVTERGGAELVPLSDSRVFWTVMLAAIAAAALLWIMLYLVPQPLRFFQGLGSVLLVASLLWPLTLDIDDAEKAWLASINIVSGVIILSLLTGTVRSIARRPRL